MMRAGITKLHQVAVFLKELSYKAIKKKLKKDQAHWSKRKPSMSRAALISCEIESSL